MGGWYAQLNRKPVYFSLPYFRTRNALYVYVYVYLYRPLFITVQVPLYPRKLE